MTELFVDDDADLALVQDRNVAVLGYDDQTAAHALCLRDSGIDVRVGLAATSALWEEAVADGLRVVTTYEACEEADLIVLPVGAGDDVDIAGAVLANLVAGDAIVLIDAAVLAGETPAGVDVVRVAPWAAGSVVRDEFAQGRGVPTFAAVVRDESGAAWELVLAYARAVGATRAGVIRTTDAEYTSSRSFAEGPLLHGGVLPLLRRGFDELVAAGCQPEVAYLRCVYGLKAFADALVGGDLDAELLAARATTDDVPAADLLPAAAAVVRSLMAWERAGTS